MGLFVLGLVIGVLIGYMIKSSKAPSCNSSTNQHNNTVQSDKMNTPIQPYPQIGTQNRSRDGHSIDELNTPIEILPNLYSLSLSNVAIKHEVTYEKGVRKYDYVTLKCRVNYKLNGRNEGKRRIIFTSYDSNGGVQAIRGEYDVYRFTDAGCEIVEVCFNDCDKNFPARFSVSIQELPDGRYV